MKKHNMLFLDDIRIPMDAFTYMRMPIYINNEWDIVRNYDEFVKYIEENGIPSFISFDHDLADEHYSPEMYKGKEAYDKVHSTFKEKTGYECAKWLVDYCMENNCELPEFVVHSMNPVGGANITNLLNNFTKYRQGLR